MKNNTEGKRKEALEGKKSPENKSRGQKLKKVLKITGIVVFFVFIAAVLSFFIWTKFIRDHKVVLSGPVSKNAGIDHPAKGDIFPEVSPFSGQDYIAFGFDSCITDNVFTMFFGYDPVNVPEPIHSIRMMEKYVSLTLGECEDPTFPSYVVLGIDPYAAFLQSCSNRNLFQDNLSFVTELANAHPDSRFGIILPEDSAFKWNSLSYEARTDARLSYILLVRQFAESSNIRVFYYPIEEWVLYSDCIRTGGPDSPIKEGIYDHLLAENLASESAGFLLTKENVNDVMDSVIERAAEIDSVYSSYADLTGKKVMFLGDSIFGNFRDESSVSSFFRDMTGAVTYNLGQGGMCAVNIANPNEPLGMAFIHLTGYLDRTAFDSAFSSYYSYGDFGLATAALADSQGEDSIFVVEYGLNDYFSGIPVEDYRNAMNRIVSELKSAYPASRILVLSPGYIAMYDNGDMPLNEESGQLSEYRVAAYEVAMENGAEFLSQTDDFGFVQEETGIYLLPDLVHYNEIGRYRVAQTIARYLK